MTSRDTEIERIASIPIGPNRTIVEYRQHVLDTLRDLRSQPTSEPADDMARQREIRETVARMGYEAGRRAASEPSLDVTRLRKAIQYGIRRTFGVLPTWTDEVTASAAAEYHRLSQPADNEAAEHQHLFEDHREPDGARSWRCACGVYEPVDGAGTDQE